MRRVACLLMVVVVVALAAPAGAVTSAYLTPPVDAPIGRGFEAPSSAYGAGHRGIDYLVASGTEVRAAGSGTVSFAGHVAGLLAVSIDHGGGLSTTYSRLGSVQVAAGQRVTRGTYLGTVDEAHLGTPGLHFGVKVDGKYVDPLSVLGPVGLSDAIHLVEVDAPAPGSADDCRKPGAIASHPAPPNDNIVVDVPGLLTDTAHGRHGSVFAIPRSLGYRRKDTYDFSYRGTRGPHLHRPHSYPATFEGIRAAARHLVELLRAIGRRHPGRDVDLITHSQGGLVARAYLELYAGPYAARLPHVDHIVTFSTPHSGAPLAADVGPVEGLPLGATIMAGAGYLARHGLQVPDPGARSVRDLAPHSDLLDRLGSMDVTFGTRTLALAMPTDVAVPADHATWPGHYSRVVGPALSPDAHGAITTSRQALATSYSFLADRSQTCSGTWDRWGPLLGADVAVAERLLPSLFAGL